MNAKKILAMILAVVLLMTATIAGTIAWLKDDTDPVVNTFTVGKVDISLVESPYTAATPEAKEVYGAPAENVANTYPAIPGNTYKKDPVVSVTADSEKCYLFVEFVYTTAADTYLNFTSNLTVPKGWTLHSKSSTAAGVTTEVWYRTVEKNDTTREWALLADLGNPHAEGITLQIDPVEVTNVNMATAAAQQLKWTAYAVQFDNVVDGDDADNTAVAEAWALAKTTN